MFEEQKTLVTGSNGLLGSEIKKLIPSAIFTDREDFDITNKEQMKNFLDSNNVTTVLDLAAFMPAPLSDKDPIGSIQVNIIGTSILTQLCIERDIKLVFISTDYVFKGDKGMYTEEDPVSPVNNYALSKLAGECAVRMYKNSLIIRTTFGPKEFPYGKAFNDQYTSRESVDIIANMIVKLLKKEATGIYHVGGKRKSVYEYAKSLPNSEKVGSFSKTELSYVTPDDTSLDTSKYRELFSSERE